MSFEILHPDGFKRPSGYSLGVAARGRMVFTAGVIGWDAEERLVSDDFVAQFRQALENVVAVLAEAGAEPRHVVRLTVYLTDKRTYLDRLREVGEAYRAVVGKHFPAMAFVQVSALMEDRAQVEIEATAVVPE
jgi:enamine deaminase RidA (YjgF/YER057c/UK114 family)